MCRSFATRRTFAAKATGIVTLCRTDLDEATLLFAAIFSEYQECTSVVRSQALQLHLANGSLIFIWYDDSYCAALLVASEEYFPNFSEASIKVSSQLTAA